MTKLDAAGTVLQCDKSIFQTGCWSLLEFIGNFMREAVSLWLEQIFISSDDKNISHLHSFSFTYCHFVGTDGIESQTWKECSQTDRVISWQCSSDVTKVTAALCLACFSMGIHSFTTHPFIHSFVVPWYPGYQDFMKGWHSMLWVLNHITSHKEKYNRKRMK